MDWEIEARVQELVDEAVENVFITIQEERGIQSGDCDPITEYYIKRKSEELAKLITHAVWTQQGGMEQ